MRQAFFLIHHRPWHIRFDGCKVTPARKQEGEIVGMESHKPVSIPQT